MYDFARADYQQNQNFLNPVQNYSNRSSLPPQVDNDANDDGDDWDDSSSVITTSTLQVKIIKVRICE